MNPQEAAEGTDRDVCRMRAERTAFAAIKVWAVRYLVRGGGGLFLSSRSAPGIGTFCAAADMVVLDRGEGKRKE